jgi:hypothetical protein
MGTKEEITTAVKRKIEGATLTDEEYRIWRR